MDPIRPHLTCLESLNFEALDILQRLGSSLFEYRNGPGSQRYQYQAAWTA